MLYGIDISSWQDDIDIPEVSTQIDFMICKCTDGLYFKDKPFDEFMRKGDENGLLLGMYHFAENQSATRQADYFYRACKDWIGKAIPFLDLETEDIQDWENFAVTFCERFESISGVRPILYISNGYTERFSKGFATKYNLWTAEYWYDSVKDFKYLRYVDWPETYPWPDALLWQFTSAGKLNGFDGRLDLDYFYGTRVDWQALTEGFEMAISDDDIERIAKRCAEYVFGEKDNRRNLNMYNATHWSFTNTETIIEMLKEIKTKLSE